MSENEELKNEIQLPVIEVPAELRGLSDEEIILRSQRELKEVSGKRKKGERRPSKRARLAMKEERVLREAAAIFASTNTNQDDASRSAVKDDTSRETKGFVSQSFKDINKAYSLNTTNFTYSKTVYSKVVPTTPPSSGRVLKASFGAKTGSSPKAVIVSAADLAMQKAEERAKKIREALQAKRNAAIASTPTATSEEEQPAKRPRGRPRKNPIV